MTESINFFLDSFQCKHLVLACGHDAGYAPVLGQFVGKKEVAEQITLVEGRSFPKEIRNLGLKSTRFSPVFSDITQSKVFASSAWGQSLPLPVAETAAEQVNYPKYHKPKAQSDRLGPVLKGEGGRRIDKQLQVDKAVADRLKKGSLCYYFYLRGKCTGCQRSHLHRPLNDIEYDALWSLARQGRCFKTQNGDDCCDVLCVYGHGSETV